MQELSNVSDTEILYHVLYNELVDDQLVQERNVAANRIVSDSAPAPISELVACEAKAPEPVPESKVAEISIESDFPCGSLEVFFGSLKGMSDDGGEISESRDWFLAKPMEEQINLIRTLGSVYTTSELPDERLEIYHRFLSELLISAPNYAINDKKELRQRLQEICQIKDEIGSPSERQKRGRKNTSKGSQPELDKEIVNLVQGDMLCGGTGSIPMRELEVVLWAAGTALHGATTGRLPCELTEDMLKEASQAGTTTVMSLQLIANLNTLVGYAGTEKKEDSNDAAAKKRPTGKGEVKSAMSVGISYILGELVRTIKNDVSLQRTL